MIYGQPTGNGRTIDITQDHWELDASIEGNTDCKPSLFGADITGGSCFCELPGPPKHNYCKRPEDEPTDVGCYEDRPGSPDFEEQLTKDGELVGIDECLELAFDNHYTYAGIQGGGICWGSSLQIGKYGSSTKCNYPCPSGNKICGGKGANSIFKLDYEKDDFCNANQKFDEMKSNGKVSYGNGGVLSNDAGDGEQFTWTPRVEGDGFNMTAVRSKDGTVKGFKTFSDNPYYNDGLKFLQWNEEEGTLTATGVSYTAVSKYAVEKIPTIEVVIEGPRPSRISHPE